MAKREWIVTADIELHGVTTIVEAESREEAEELTKDLKGDGFDTSAAELVNWRITKVEANDA